MRRTDRILSLLFLTLSLFLMLFSCDGNGEGSTAPESTPEVTLPETDPTPTELVLIENGQSDFKIIRGENATGYYKDTAIAVHKKLNSIYNAGFSISIDWYNKNTEDPSRDHEILLFDTNRAESAAALEDLTFEGYLIRVTDCKIVVVGSSPANSNAALYELFDVILPKYTKDTRIALPIGLEIKKEFSESDFDLEAAIRGGKKVCAHIEQIFNYPAKDGFTAAQGVATDGKYIYTVVKNASGSSEVDRIVKVDMETLSIVKESETLPLDHANDMTYDPVRKQLVVVNMYNNLITLIETENLTVTERHTLPYGTWATGYIPSLDRFTFLAYGTPSGLVITDKDFTPISSSPLASAPDYVGQGMDTDDKFAYVPLSPSSGKSDNIIQIYDIATGEYLGIVSIMTKMESESIFHIGNDFFIQFNYKGSTICTLEFYEQFE